MLDKELTLSIWQKYSGKILPRPERLAFYQNCSALLRFDEETLRTALNFCKKEEDFSLKRVAQMARAVRQGTVSKILKRSEKDRLIEEIIHENGELVPVTELDRRIKEKTAGRKVNLIYTDVERGWRIAALTLAEVDENWRARIKPRARSNSLFDKVVPMQLLNTEHK